MVNSKKMSKSTVAVVVLAMLLVLSLVLSATGAWFTHKDSNAADDSSFTFRVTGMNIAIDATAESHIERDEDGDNTYEVTSGIAATDLMPGDKIVGGDVTVTFTVANGEDAWYIVKVGEKWYSADGVEVTEATGLKKVSQISGETNKLTFGGVDVTVPDTTDNTQQGKPYSYAGLGAMEIRMIQTENISQTEAYNALTAGEFQDNYVGA